ncbi:MAG TPA: EAL domain-containing protein, partial [Candidatus Dormibacteraeota bacterium]|nr:EAL domain-containing protein [Candidatus Dormibacteraeota bacterium]
MGMETGPGEVPVGDLGKRTRPGAALLPVFNIPDRATIGYEVLPRPDELAPPLDVVRRALEVAQYTSPAILLIPFGGVARLEDFDPRGLAREFGVAPSEVAWVVSSDLCTDTALAQRVADLRSVGFRCALEAHGWANAQHECIATLRPDFLMIEPSAVQQVPDNAVARAELAALISFTRRLDVGIIARGVDTPAVASALATVGLQHGSGAPLSAPLVLQSEVAA